MLRYHCRHLGTGEEKKKRKKRQAGKHSTRKIGKETPKRSNELDLLSEICQMLYHTRSILSGNCNIVELQTLRHRRSLSNKQLPYATTACLSFILIYLPNCLFSLLPLRSRYEPLFRRGECWYPPSFFSSLINVQFSPILKFKTAECSSVCSAACTASSLAEMNGGAQLI